MTLIRPHKRAKSVKRRRYRYTSISIYVFERVWARENFEAQAIFLAMCQLHVQQFVVRIAKVVKKKTKMEKEKIENNKFLKHPYKHTYMLQKVGSETNMWTLHNGAAFRHS